MLICETADSSHNIMSGTLASLTPASVKTQEQRDRYQRLIMHLEDPYFRAMLTYLAFGDWADVLEEEHIPLRERLAIALQFFDDDALSVYLRRIAEASVSHGDVEGIIVTGLTVSGMQLLQNYVDRTGDVQTAAILGAYVHPHQLKDVRVDQWLDAYRDLLDGWKFFHHRCQLDIDRGQMLQDFTQDTDREPVQLVAPQILIRCNYCNQVISEPRGVNTANGVSARFHSLSTSSLLSITKMEATACPFCNRPLPRCSVCLMTLGIIPDSTRNGQLAHHNAPMRGKLTVYASRIPHFNSLVNGVIQIVLTMQSYFVRPAGMADMLRTSSSGFTVRLARSHEEPARLQIVIIDALMNFERLGAQNDSFYISFPISPLVSRIP